jgi:hypothetical protein
MRSSTAVRLRMLALSTLMVALTGCTQASHTANQPTPTPNTSITSASPTSSPTPLPLGPNGYGALTLGMTKAQAAATGLTAGTTPTGAGTCGGPSDGHLAIMPKPDPEFGWGQLYFDTNTGQLVSIQAAPGVKTPEGIGIGDSYDQLHATYPAWVPVGSGPSKIDGRGGVAIPNNPNAHYRVMVQNSKIVQLSLDSNLQRCYE